MKSQLYTREEKKTILSLNAESIYITYTKELGRLLIEYSINEHDAKIRDSDI